MASSSETAEKKSEVCPTEDLVLALIEKLVDPRLPFRVSKNDPPNLSVQQAVAKQMHAVVLLYNYYHRKQHPNIEFLEFTAFCKLSVILRQTMIAFMKFMNQGDSMEPNDLKDGLSVTEKAIRDACKISIALDASKDVPNMEGWPISKVAVLLIDSKRENCLLQFGSFTEGVWSLIEKEIDESNISSKLSVEETAGNKRRRNSRTPRTENNADDNRFLQLAFNAVKEVTGITNSELVILETHVVYSLSKEKTATRFYMMQCAQSISENERVPVEDIVKSLQGPLVEKICGSWTITAVVEHYHMHPYAAIISSWFTRTCSPMPSLDDSKSQSTKEFSGRRILNITERSTINKFVDHAENMCSPTIDNACAKLANENNDSNNKKCKRSSSVKDAGPVNISQVTGKDHNSMNKCNPTHENINSAQNVLHNNDEVLNLNGGKECLKGSPSCLPSEPHRIEDVGNNQISKLKVYHKKKNFSSMQIDASPPRVGMKLEAAMADSFKSNDVQGTDDKVSGENCFVTSSSNQSGIPLASAEPVPLEANKKHTKEVQNTQASETMESALILLYRRRQELYSQICSMEDELVLCEGNIERIRGGGEVSLADEHVKLVVSGRNSICSKRKNQAEDKAFQLGEGLGESQWKLQMGLSGALVPRNSSQDLEFMCLKNNWRLPKYFVEPSDGEFISEVVLKGNDFKFSSMGDLKNNPYESRESAAARIIAKLRNF